MPSFSVLMCFNEFFCSNIPNIEQIYDEYSLHHVKISNLNHFEIIALHNKFCNFTQVKNKYLFNSKIKYLLLLLIYIVLHLDCEARLDLVHIIQLSNRKARMGSLTRFNLENSCIIKPYHIVCCRKNA